MAIKAKINKATSYNVNVDNFDGSLTTRKPISLRNVVGELSEIKKIKDLLDVQEVQEVDGAGLQYNQQTDKYEIKLLELDGGHF